MKGFGVTLGWQDNILLHADAKWLPVTGREWSLLPLPKHQQTSGDSYSLKDELCVVWLGSLWPCSTPPHPPPPPPQYVSMFRSWITCCLLPLHQALFSEALLLLLWHSSPMAKKTVITLLVYSFDLTYCYGMCLLFLFPPVWYFPWRRAQTCSVRGGPHRKKQHRRISPSWELWAHSQRKRT